MISSHAQILILKRIFKRSVWRDTLFVTSRRFTLGGLIMPYKKRLYYKQEEAKQDYSLFVIACRAPKTEPSYFAPFDEIDRIKVRLLEHSATESAPSHILERAKLYIAEEGLDAKYGDFGVTDVDKWANRI